MALRASHARGLRGGILLAAVALLAWSCGGWTEFRSEAGKYRIEFPGSGVGERQSSDGRNTVRVAHYAVDESTAYGVAWYDIPKPEKSPHSLLLDAQAQILRNLKAGIESANEIKLGDGADAAPGRAFTARTDKGIAISIRLYAVGQEPMRIYQLIAAVPDLGKAKRDIDKFFGSFQVLK